MDALMPSQTKTKITLVALGVFVGSCLLGWPLIIGRSLDKIKALKADEVNLRSQKVVADRLQALQSQINQNKDFFSEEGAETVIIQKMSQLAQQAGMLVLSATPQAKNENDLVRRDSFQLELRGSYHQLGKFISLLESQKPGIKVSDVRIDKNQNTGFGYANSLAPEYANALRVNLVATVYYAKNDEAFRL